MLMIWEHKHFFLVKFTNMTFGKRPALCGNQYKNMHNRTQVQFLLAEVMVGQFEDSLCGFCSYIFLAVSLFQFTTLNSTHVNPPDFSERIPNFSARPENLPEPQFSRIFPDFPPGQQN